MEPETTATQIADNVEKSKKRWSDFSPQQQKAIGAAAIVEFVLTVIAVVDLVRRPSTRLRGSKPFWLAAFAVQPFGPILYFLVGRRRSSR